MSLLKYAMEPCRMYDKVSVPDGRGGFTRRWQEGAEFDAAVVVDDSTESLSAQAQGVTAIYTVTTSRNINLQYHDVFRRISDGKIFRVKTDGDDVKTPATATLDMRNVRAEEWELD